MEAVSMVTRALKLEYAGTVSMSCCKSLQNSYVGAQAKLTKTTTHGMLCLEVLTWRLSAHCFLLAESVPVCVLSVVLGTIRAASALAWLVSLATLLP